MTAAARGAKPSLRCNASSPRSWREDCGPSPCLSCSGSGAMPPCRGECCYPPTLLPRRDKKLGGPRRDEVGPGGSTQRDDVVVADSDQDLHSCVAGRGLA